MASPSRLTIAKKDIFALFDQSARKVYAHGQLARVLTEHRSNWRLAQRTTAADFISFLKKQGKLVSHTFRTTTYNKETTRYSWGTASIYELAQSLQPRGYLSHSTAVALHALTDLIPKNLYLNVEQSPKPSSRGFLTQDGIDKAFARQQRQSNLVYQHEDWSITIISGKSTGALGVEELLGPSQEKLRVTNLERTLVDIVVRPSYAGGSLQVLQAYRMAKDRLSTNRLIATLKKLDYTYPYHQAIGFLMERAGYDEKRLTALQNLGINYDFYLSYGLKQSQYSKRWRLFFPSGLNG